MFFYIKDNVKHVFKKESIKKFEQIIARKNVDKQIQNKKMKLPGKNVNINKK